MSINTYCINSYETIYDILDLLNFNLLFSWITQNTHNVQTHFEVLITCHNNWLDFCMHVYFMWKVQLLSTSNNGLSSTYNSSFTNDGLSSICNYHDSTNNLSGSTDDGLLHVVLTTKVLPIVDRVVLYLQS